MENLEQKKRRLYGKRNLKKYLKELNAITNLNVTQEHLLSIVKSDEVSYLKNGKSVKTKISFEDKETLSLLFDNLLKLKDGSVYLSIAYSKDCGIFLMKSLKDFNINFKFNDEHSGLIVMILEDLSNKLILDFYEENEDLQLEIEIFGMDWTKALSIDREEK